MMEDRLHFEYLKDGTQRWLEHRLDRDKECLQDMYRLSTAAESAVNNISSYIIDEEYFVRNGDKERASQYSDLIIKEYRSVMSMLCSDDD